MEIAREVRKWEQEGRIISKAPQRVNSMMLEIMWVQLQGCPGQGQCQCSLENLYSSTQEGMYISNTSSFALHLLEMFVYMSVSFT